MVLMGEEYMGAAGVRIDCLRGEEHLAGEVRVNEALLSVLEGDA